MAFEEFGMGDETAKGLGNDVARRFKVEEGKEYVLSFAWWPEGDDGKPDLSSDPRFVKATRIYVEKCGNVLYEGPEYDKFSKGGEDPRTYVGTVVIVWPVDSDGKIDMAMVKAKRWQVIPWIMSEGKFGKIRSQHGRFPFSANDLFVKCPKGGTQFQQMDFQPYPGGEKGSAFAAMLRNSKAWKILKAQIEAAVPKVRSEIGRSMTIAQILEKRGEEGVQPVDLGMEDVDVDDEIDGILDED